MVEREKYGRSHENRLRVSPLLERMSLACSSQFLLYELLIKTKAIWGYELRPAEIWPDASFTRDQNSRIFNRLKIRRVNVAWA